MSLSKTFPSSFFSYFLGMIPVTALFEHLKANLQADTLGSMAVVEHWLEREIYQWVHHEGSIYGLGTINI